MTVLIISVAFVALNSSGLARKNNQLCLVAIVIYLLVLKFCKLLFDDTDRTWGNGARGEERLGNHLDVLESRGWTILHDVVLDGWNIDHVAIGPTGVFTIETKSHPGRISFDGTQLVRSGKPLEKDFLRQAKSQALWLGKQLSQRGHPEFVTPIVCFTRALVRVPRATTRPVVVVPLKGLLETLERGKPRMQGADLTAVTTAVREVCREAAGRVSSDELAGRGARGALTRRCASATVRPPLCL